MATGPHDNSRWRYWRRWTLACAAGEFLGIAAAAGAAVGPRLLWGEPVTFGARMGVLAAMLVAGLLEGLAVGSFQWLVLRDRFPAIRARAWIGVTVVVAVLGWLLGMLPSTFGAAKEAAYSAPDLSGGWVAALAAFFGLAVGAFFGGAQWLVMRRHARRAGRWVLANALGWAPAMVWIYLAATMPSATTPLLAVVLLGAGAGLLAGLSFGAVTGLFLLHLHPRYPVMRETVPS